MNNELASYMIRLFLTFLGGLLAIVEPALPLFYLCLTFVFLDCLSAFLLTRRVAKKYPERVGKNGGKFRSDKFRHVVLYTVPMVLAGLVMAHWAQVLILEDTAVVDLPKVVAGCICGWQLWSFLENTSSCEGAEWARIIRKYTIDKTERHFEIDLSEIKHEDKKGEKA